MVIYWWIPIDFLPNSLRFKWQSIHSRNSVNFLETSGTGSIKWYQIQVENTIGVDGKQQWSIRDEFEKLTKVMADISVFVREGFQ